MIHAVPKALSQHKIHCATLDNNQKGNPRKFQRFGSRNFYLKVTGRCLHESISFNQTFDISYKVPITYVDQVIPSAYGMTPFEQVYSTSGDDILTNIANYISGDLPVHLPSTDKIDISGSRVSSYINVLHICDALLCQFKYLTGFNKSTNEFKQWRNQPSQYKDNNTRKVIIQLLCLTKHNMLSSAYSFQQRCTEVWNPYSKAVTKIIIPPVSMIDEITIEGFGMAIIELMTLVGILEVHYSSNKTGDTIAHWDLCDGWDSQVLYLFMDGLSLDRHRTFQKRLATLDMKFTDAFEQSMTFQKALTRVIELNGPLHMAFHMLQCVFTLFSGILKLMQEVLQWKRIRHEKVSESFALCKALLFLGLEELERLLWDVVIIENEVEISESLSNYNANEYCIWFSEKYISCLQHMATIGTDMRQRYFSNFILVAREFRLYWKALSSGDRLKQEECVSRFIGVFMVMKKHKYVQIFLDSIDH